MLVNTTIDFPYEFVNLLVNTKLDFLVGANLEIYDELECLVSESVVVYYPAFGYAGIAEEKRPVTPWVRIEEMQLERTQHGKTLVE